MLCLPLHLHAHIHAWEYILDFVREWCGARAPPSTLVWRVVSFCVLPVRKNPCFPRPAPRRCHDDFIPDDEEREDATKLHDAFPPEDKEGVEASMLHYVRAVPVAAARGGRGRVPGAQGVPRASVPLPVEQRGPGRSRDTPSRGEAHRPLFGAVLTVGGGGRERMQRCCDAFEVVCTAAAEAARNGGVGRRSGITDIMDFEYIAYGNAEMSKSGKVTCQHGPVECTGNMAEECTKNQTGGNPVKYIPFDACLQGGSDITTKSIKKCATDNKLDGDDIVKCLSDGRGTKLIAAAAKKSYNHILDTFNGMYFQGVSELVEMACKFWKGTEPEFCKKA